MGKLRQKKMHVPEYHEPSGHRNWRLPLFEWEHTPERQEQTFEGLDRVPARKRFLAWRKPSFLRGKEG